ncbi:MAG: DUF444 family protein [Pseudomonadota bacterium]|nr:DUF444 family protein [Pseudomonadota bacterium]
MSDITHTNRRPSSRWYELFSRGARDWLRHNKKVRDAVREQLPELIARLDITGGDGNRKLGVPVRFLEHYRFHLLEAESTAGTGQGKVGAGDVLRPADSAGDGEAGKGRGGSGEGGLEFVLELKVDDIVDWLWEEMQLPNLRPREGNLEDEDLQREGWDRRGARSRLDRRRSLKEALKRRAVQPGGAPFSNEDLRFRQLTRRRRPVTRAVVFFALDVSSSMSERDRQLAKTFFFWVAQGLRRQYAHVEVVFVAHTVQAWEFGEAEFFQVRGSGGTVASTAFLKVLDIMDQRFDPSRYNIYLFYASDGENFAHDRATAGEALEKLAAVVSFMGYVETMAGPRAMQTETANLFRAQAIEGAPAGSYPLSADRDVWEAIRKFFGHETGAVETVSDRA